MTAHPSALSMIVRTVLGDVDPSVLGVTLGHEHLMTHPPASVTDADLVMDDAEAATRELESFKRAGGGALVEMTTVDYGRDAAELEQVSRASGVHVIAATGFNKGKFAEAMTAGASVEDIERWMTDEVTVGVRPFGPPGPRAERSSARAGLVKASSSLNAASPNERKVFEAACAVHGRTGVPIGTHTEKGTWALEQVAVFLGHRVDPGKVLIGHLDLKPDLPYLLEVAASGVNLGLDQFGKEKYLPDEERVRLIVRLCEAGHARQLILSGDMARKTYFKSHGGGPGLEHIPTRVRAMLEQAGLGRDTIHDILIHNPRRWLGFRPGRAPEAA